MSPPPPLDPYVVLGVAKDADISAIRSAHRKLVLRCHPDRIRDEANKAEGKALYQKVQEAYEILSDPDLRARHDNKVKLAELRKEAKELSGYSSQTWSHEFEAPTPRRGFQDQRAYKEPKSSRSIFEEGYRYREDEPRRASSRKYDVYERKASASGEDGGKKKTNAREGVKDKSTRGELYASSVRERERERDRDRRREQADRSTRRVYVESDTSSDSDTHTPPRSSKRPERLSRPGLSRRRKTESTPHERNPIPRNSSPSIRGSNLKHSETHDSRGRGFWGSDPESPRQNHQRTSSVYSHTSGRNGSLRGHDSFDRGYQRPTYSRPRAGSAASGGSAGSRYDIDRASPGLPPMPRSSRSYRIVDDDDDVFESILIDPEDRRRRARSPSPPIRERERDRADRSQRPILSTRNRGAERNKSRRASMPLVDTAVQPKNPPDESRVPRVEPFRDTARVAGPDPLRPEPSSPQAEGSGIVDCDVCGWEVKVERKRDWQKHLFEDLRPYVCLEDGCPSASETYTTTMKLLAHVKRQHSDAELLTAKKLTCPFCLEELPQERLQRIQHVGSHMEDIALASVTRAHEDWAFYSDSEKYLSSVGGIEQRGDDNRSESSKLAPAIPETRARAATQESKPSAERKAIPVSASPTPKPSKANNAPVRAEFEVDRTSHRQRLRPNLQENHIDLESLQRRPRPDTAEARANLGKATTKPDEHPPKKSTPATKAKGPTKHKESNPEPKSSKKARPDAESTRPSDSVDVDIELPKKDRPRVQRTGGISSWADWKAASPRHKAKKGSTP